MKDMRAVNRFVGVALTIGLFAACADEVTAPSPEPSEETSVESSDESLAVKGPPPDVSGAWTWNNVESIRMPTHIAVMVGINPEGPNTLARCESAGSMTLLQAGSSFEGIAHKTSNSCVTKGGQTFQQPGTVFSVVDGQVRGQQLRFSFESFLVRPCPHRAVIRDVVGGLAVALDGTGRCILPGHPQSESPLTPDPPPGGTSVTLNWEAERP